MTLGTGLKINGTYQDSVHADSV